MSARRRTSSRPTQPVPNTPQSATHTTGPAGSTGPTSPVDAADAPHDAGVTGARRSHRARRGHRGRAKRRPVWAPLAVAVLVAGGGTAYVALGDSGAGNRSVADGAGRADRVRIVESASPATEASGTPSGADRTPGTPGPSPSKSARPSADAAKEAERQRGSRSAGPRGDAERPGSAAGDGAARDGSADSTDDDTNDTAKDTANDNTAAGPTTRPGSDAGRGGTTAEVLALVNQARADAGCRALTANGTLNRVADTYAGVMADTQNLSHTGPDGSSVGDRVTRSGYTWSSVGENIARGQADAEAVMDVWMKSPGHRANILNCSFREMGIDVDQGSGGPWWTQVFATSR